MNENEAARRKIPTFINIKNFRNLKDLKFELFEGKVNIILGKNNVGKSNLLDYINSWYIKNNKNDTYETFYLKDGEKFTKRLSSPITFEVKKVLLRSVKENETKNFILRSFECNEHHYFEIESSIFGIKRNIVLTKCRRSLMLCSLKNYKELCWNERKSDYLESPISVKELETVLKEGIFFLFDEILKNVKVLSPDRFYGLGELSTHKKESKSNGFYFKFKFSFLDPWDGKKKSLGLGTEKIIFLNLLLNVLQGGEKLLVLSTKNDRKWRHENWIFSFLSFSRQKSVLLIDKPETFLHPGYEREFLISLKKLTEKRNNCDVIIATNSSECLLTFPSEIYDGNLSVTILDQWGKIVYLKKIIDKTKNSILEDCVKYGNVFRKKLEKPDKFYRNKWIEILSKEYTSKLFFSKKVLFVEGSTEVVFFSYSVLDLLLKRLKEKIVEWSEKIDKIVEEVSLSEEEKGTSSEEKILKSVWARQQRDEFKSYYVKFIDERKFWEKFNEVRIVPIFGKLNYIFFAKISESLWLEHKFLLDNDKKNVDKKDTKVPEEEIKWEIFHEINKGKNIEKQLKSWKEHEYRTTSQKAQKALNEGWLWPNDKFFYDSTTYCKTSKKNKCYCKNITWIEEDFEKFIGLKRSNEFGWTNPEINLIEQIDTIIANLVDNKETETMREEKWRIVINLILEDWKYRSYGFCKEKEIENYRNG